MAGETALLGEEPAEPRETLCSVRADQWQGTGGPGFSPPPPTPYVEASAERSPQQEATSADSLVLEQLLTRTPWV